MTGERVYGDSDKLAQKSGDRAASTAGPLAEHRMEAPDMHKVPDSYDSRDIDSRLEAAARILRRAMDPRYEASLVKSCAAALEYVEQARAIRSVDGLD